MATHEDAWRALEAEVAAEIDQLTREFADAAQTLVREAGRVRDPESAWELGRVTASVCMLEAIQTRLGERRRLLARMRATTELEPRLRRN